MGFLHADARTHRFAPLRFDVIVNQLGVTGFANLAGALRPGGRLVSVSFDPESVDAELRRAGLVQCAAGRAEAEPPSWLVTAGAGRSARGQLARSQRTPVSADGWRSRDSARASI